MKPGWYPDPNTAGMVRWWDGESWADMVMPKDLAPRPPKTGDLVAEGLGNLAKLIFLLLLLALLLVIAWVVF